MFLKNIFYLVDILEFLKHHLRVLEKSYTILHMLKHPFPYALAATIVNGKNTSDEKKEFVTYAKYLYEDFKTMETVYTRALQLLTQRECEITVLKQLLLEREEELNNLTAILRNQ